MSLTLLGHDFYNRNYPFPFWDSVAVDTGVLLRCLIFDKIMM